MDFNLQLKNVLSLFLFFSISISSQVIAQGGCLIQSEVSNIGCNDVIIRKVSNSGHGNYFAQVRAGTTARIWFENNFRYAFYAEGEMVRVWSPSSCDDVNQYVDSKGCVATCDIGSLTITNESDCEAEVYINNVMHHTIPANTTLTRSVVKNWLFRLQIPGERDTRQLYRASDHCEQSITFNGECVVAASCMPRVSIINDTECDGVLLFNNSAARILEAGDEVIYITQEGYTWQFTSFDNSVSSKVYTSSADCEQDIVFDMECEVATEPAQTVVLCSMMSDDSFEDGWGTMWHDGGSDCALQRNTSMAEDGQYTVRLRDNSGMASSMYTEIMDMEEVVEANLGFSFEIVSFEMGENFVVEYSVNGGASYMPIYTWTFTEESINHGREQVLLNIDREFSEETIFRIRCNASSNADLMYLDNVFLEVCEMTEESLTEGIIAESRSGETDVEELADISVEPTLVSTHVDISSKTTDASGLMIHIHDLTGKIVTTQRFNSAKGTSRVDMSALSQGMYIVNVLEDGIRIHTQKIVKQ